MSGCPDEVTGPSPTVEQPTAGAALPIDPGLICRDQLTTPVVVHGERFSPIPFDIPDDPKAALPTVALLRTLAIDGGPGDATVQTWHGEPDGPNAARLSWQSQRQLTFVVDQSLDLESGGTGRLAVGLYDVRVTNANGNHATSEASLGVIDKPTLSDTDPGITCLAQGPRTVGLAGDSLLRLQGADAALAVEGVAARFALSSFAECTRIPHPGLDAQICDAAEVVFAQDSVPVGYPRLTIENPETAACVSEEDTRLRVVPPPSIDTFRPPLVCVAQGPRDVVLVGHDLLGIDGAVPDATLDGAAIASGALAECEELPAQGHDVTRCGELTVTVPQEDTQAPRQPVMGVTNPAPAGCVDTTSEQLVLVPPPHIEDVQPPVICADGVDQTLRLTGSYFLVIDGVKPEITVDATTLAPAAVTPSGCAPLAVPGLTVESCDTLDILVSPSMVEGDAATIAITNPPPAGCSDTYAIEVPLVDPPAVTAVTPALVCTDDGARELIITGSNFYVVSGVNPTVTLDGVEAAVTAASDCIQGAIGPLSDVRTCGSLTVTAPMGSLEPGSVTVHITSAPPIPCTGDADDVLVAPPRVAVTAVAPDAVCTIAGDATVTVQGQGFLDVAGALPSVALAGTAYPIVTGSMAGCTDLGVPSLAVRSCTTFRLFVPAGSLAEGDIAVSVTNAAPSGCGTVQTEVFFSVPVPTFTSVTPVVFCADTTNTLTLTGTNFSPASDVFLTSAQGATYDATVAFVSATTLEATFGDIPPGIYDITVENALGCAATLLDKITVHPTPLVFFVDPPVVYNGITTTATIYLSGLEEDAASAELVGPSGQAITLNGTSAPGQPNRINAIIPEGIEVGSWAVRITSQLGCVGVLDGAVLVTDEVTITISDVSPDFVWEGTNTAITIVSDPGDFLMTPRAYLNPTSAAEGTPATNVRALLFDNANTLTGVVPGPLLQAGEVYELIVINPDATVGIYTGVTITVDPPPLITAVVPASFATNAPFPAAIEGEGFDVDTVTMRCLVPDGLGGFDLYPPISQPGLPVQVNPATATDTSVPAVFPSNDPNLEPKSVCTVTLTNQDGTSFRFSAVSLKNAAQNLGEWRATGQNLVQARRGLGLVAGRPTSASRVVYAVGGDDGALAGAKSSVEAAGVDIFGNLGPWTLQRHALPAPRTFAGVARVGRFLYVVGGHAAGGASRTVYRAEILDPLATPEFVDLAITLDDTAPIEGVGPGVWIYRIAAVFPNNDPNNPGGESLPGEPIVVQLPDIPGLELAITWDAIPGASGYRIYRTVQAGDGVDTVALIGTTTGGAATTFMDNGRPTGAATPLFSGSLGVWRAVGDGLVNAREAHALLAAPHPTVAGRWVLYAAGGRDPNGGGAGVATHFATYEYAVIDLFEPTAIKGRQLHTVSGWTVGGRQLGAARADLGAFLVTQADVVAGAARGQIWVYFGPGRGAAGGISRLDAGVVQADGSLGFPPDGPAGGGSLLMAPAGSPPAYLGYGAAMANSRLFIVGGGSGPGSPDNRVRDGVLCVGVPGTPGCGGSGSLPDTGTWTPQGGGVLSGARIFLAVAQESAFLFAAGGVGPAGSVTSLVDTTVQ